MAYCDTMKFALEYPSLQVHQVTITTKDIFIYAIIILIQLLVPSLTEKSEAIIYASKVQEDMCTPLNGSVAESNNTVSKCCGFCYSEPDCSIYGTCCLGMLESFEEGKVSLESTRFECVLPQLITSSADTFFATAPDTEAVLMISKCDPKFERYGIGEFCENPGRLESIYSLLPVRNGSVDYRNIFCAYCNGVDLLTINNWRMEIHCNETLTITDTNFLKSVRHKRCNIFYRPPWYQSAIPCRITQYKISQCNETGLWQVNNDTIKQACESFVDPFNSTYQNYFCYMCNSRYIMPRESWYCPNPLQNAQNAFQRPVYISTPDISLLTNERNKEIGCDLTTQFLDYKMVALTTPGKRASSQLNAMNTNAEEELPEMKKRESYFKLCRDKLCHSDRRLTSFKCRMKADLPRPRPCVSTFVKVTALDGIKLEARLKNDLNLLLEIEQTIHRSMHVQAVIRKIDVFVESKRPDKTTSVDYDILKLLLFTDKLYPNDVLKMLLLNIHQKTLRLKSHEQAQFFFELATYIEQLYDTNKDIIYVPLPNSNLSATQ